MKSFVKWLLFIVLSILFVILYDAVFSFVMRSIFLILSFLFNRASWLSSWWIIIVVFLLWWTILWFIWLWIGSLFEGLVVYTEKLQTKILKIVWYHRTWKKLLIILFCMEILLDIFWYLLLFNNKETTLSTLCGVLFIKIIMSFVYIVAINSIDIKK